MGGNAFKDLKRVTKQEYNQLYSEVSSKLLASVYESTPNKTPVSTRSYFAKETFGDMDLVVCTKGLKPDWLECLVREFSLDRDEYVKNGPVLSFKYKNFQVDLLLTNEDNYQTTVDYFSWNDLSNLMGRVSYKHGLKFGHQGTYVVVKDGSNQIGEVLVTKSTQELCEYFGWDFEEWNTGFETMEDAYSWLVKTPYFNKSVFALENRNHAATIRDKKRPNYTNFLTWLETQNGLPEYQYSEQDSKGGYYLREPYYTMLCGRWPEVKPQVDRLLEEYKLHKLFKERLNGSLVMEVTGLSGKSLGDFMSKLKSDTELCLYVMSQEYDEEELKKKIRSLHFECNGL